MKLNKIFLFILAGGLLTASCKKELDQQDPQAFGDANAFQTIEHVELGVNGAYGRMSTYVNDIFKNALTSDEVKIGPQNGGSGLLTYRLQYGSDATTGGDVTAGYYGYYNLIDQVNRVLPHVDEVIGGTTERKNYLKAALLGLRGIAHFGLLQSFAGTYDPNGLGVAIMTEYNPNAQPARAKMGDVMAQIESDLSTSKSLLPPTTSLNFSDTVLNQLNIEAFQARIALYRRDYDAAINHATNVIASDIRPLVTGTTFANMWKDQSNGDVLFRVRTLTSTILGAFFTNAAGGILLSPSDKLRSQYAAGDERYSVYFGQNSNGDWYVNKYFESPRGPRMVDIKVIRTAEMYLIRAEAYAAKGNVTLGSADLNLLRSIRISGYVDETFPSPEALKTAIVNERYKELAFEGQRFYDLKRLKLDLERFASDAAPEWQYLRWNSPEDFRFVYPIPRDATNANPNTDQNPNY
ncbi:MAG: RagB/SusD family nutrient uptake outer membrane protein [Bacteroidetes bacterium]|nr:RagB/SusD family nutrient uptake outer membrane protein [Bacteroidota bacterium]